MAYSNSSLCYVMNYLGVSVIAYKHFNNYFLN